MVYRERRIVNKEREEWYIEEVEWYIGKENNNRKKNWQTKSAIKDRMRKW